MREYVDARIEEVKSHVAVAQTEFNADMSGVTKELKDIDSKVDSLPGIGKIFGAIVVAITLLLAVLGLMGDRFDAGLEFGANSTQKAIEAERQANEAKELANKTAKDFQALSQQWSEQADRIDKIIPALEAIVNQAKTPPQPMQGGMSP